MIFGFRGARYILMVTGVLVGASLASEQALAQADAAKDFPTRPVHRWSVSPRAVVMTPSPG